MNESADVVIIGSGVAGALCAWRLAQKGLKVLILEAGPRIERKDIVQGFVGAHHLDLSAGFPNERWAPRPDWGTPTDDYIRQTGKTARIEYLRVVGGTTWHWGAHCVRFLPRDFRIRSLYGVGDDWPISYDDIEPFYALADKEFGVCGNDAEDGGSPRSTPFPLPPIPFSLAERTIAQKLAGLGYRFAAYPAARNTRDYDGRPQCRGYGVCSPICPIGAQYSASVHVHKAEALGVRLIENARVDRIEAAPDGRIVAAHFKRPDGSEGAATGRIFVLAANGVESPRLLLASASERYPAGLANASDQVGRNFNDHPGSTLRLVMPDAIYSGRGPQATHVCNDLRDGPSRSTHAAMKFVAYTTVKLHDVAEHYLKQGLRPPELDRAIRHHALRQVEFDAHIEQLPDPDNRITIDWSDRDTAGQPRMVLHYGLGEYEQRAGAVIAKMFDDFVRVTGGHDHGRQHFVSHHHLMSALRMGNNPRTSVVDGECRAHDHPNLFVGGSAVFTTGGTANPTLTVAALSLRMAETIGSQFAGK
jgi:choline dehydrogenase-like flavoprotein